MRRAAAQRPAERTWPADGFQGANIALFTNYMAASFVAATDGNGGTLVTEKPQTEQQPLLTHPPHG